MSSSILFVDARVNDYQSLLVDLSADVEVHLLNAEEDGILQMDKVLAGRQNLDSIQIVSHGSSGVLSLGSTLLTGDNLTHYKNSLEKIGTSLSEKGDILLYGCNVAQSDKGLHFVNRLAEITKADVAASDDLTGSEVLGGDWELEQSTGLIESSMINIPLSYQATLALKEGTSGDDTLYGGGTNDTIDGKKGNDKLYGQNGDDSKGYRQSSDYLSLAQCALEPECSD